MAVNARLSIPAPFASYISLAATRYAPHDGGDHSGVGRQSRRKRERDRGLDAVNGYFRRVGLPNRPEGTAYRRLAAAEPEWFRRFSDLDDASLAPGAGPEEIREAARAKYELLYRDLDTALAEYASRPVAVAHAWLRWWSEHHPPATRLLDVGCGPAV